MPKKTIDYPVRNEEERGQEADGRDCGAPARQYYNSKRRPPIMEKTEGVSAPHGSTASFSFRAGGPGKDRARKGLALFVFAAALVSAAAEPSPKARTIDYRDAEDIPHIYLLTGFTTEIKLPKEETIANVQLGTSFFEAGFLGHTANVKPEGTETGKRTNVQILCLSGNEYSFIVEEVSKKPGPQADLKVFVNNADKQAQEAMHDKQKFYTADQVAVLDKQIADMGAQLKQERESRKQAVAGAEKKAIENIRHDYEFYDAKGANFHPSGYNDERFSYFEVRTSEIPALFEIKDGKPSLIEKQFTNGRYVVPKILDAGEMRVGKSSVKFKRVS